MKKKYIKIIIECLIVFTSIFVYNTFEYSTYDHIIDFTHCYSIANGLKIYKDFNIVVGPIYPIFISIFLKIFGKNFLVFDIVNSLIVVVIYLIIRKNNKRTLAILTIVSLHYVLTAKYNTFTLLLFYIIYYIDKGNNKYKDYLIGFLLSILLFTKINVGCALIIPTIVLNIKSPKIILKRFIPFFITSSIILFIMWLKGVLPGFINYTLLGLISFTKNSKCDFTVVFLILCVIYIILNIKRDKYLIYMLCYLIICYPLFDQRHIFLAIFPTIVYIIDKANQKQNNLIQNFVIIVSVILFLIINIINIDKITTISLNKRYYLQNKNLSLILEKINIINKNLEEYKKGYRVFYFAIEAYMFKLDLNKNIDKYDFIWNGNMGYKGEEKYIEEIKKYCNNNRCMFIIDENYIKNKTTTTQINKNILKFIRKEYNKKTDNDYINKTIFSIYTND